MKYMDPTISDHHLTLKMTKNDGKSKLSLKTENEAEDISTMSYGKAIRLQKHHGNRPCVSKMVQKTSFKNIKTETSYNHEETPNSWHLKFLSLWLPIQKDDIGNQQSTNPNPKRNFIWRQDFIPNSHHPLLKNLISSPLHHIPQHRLHFFDLSNERYRSCSNPDQITRPQTSLSNRFRFTNFFKRTMMDNSLLSTNSQTFTWWTR